MYNLTDTQRQVLSTLLANLMTDQPTVSLAHLLDQYLRSKEAVLSPHTLRDYGLTFKRLLDHVDGATAVTAITPDQLRGLLRSIPGGKKNKQNAHIALSALWTFALQENLAAEHTPRRVQIARPERRAIIPFSETEVRQLLAAAQASHNPERDHAVVLLLLDTGLRAAELSGLRLDDLQGDYVRVMGKGSKERLVPVSQAVKTALAVYLSTCRIRLKRSSAVFVAGPNAFSRDTLRQLMERLGKAAGLPGVHAHKFRHTFAVNYLLNGGDPYTLQDTLGHATMDMVKRYLHLTDRDMRTVHQRASPLIGWGLSPKDPP